MWSTLRAAFLCFQPLLARYSLPGKPIVQIRVTDPYLFWCARGRIAAP